MIVSIDKNPLKIIGHISICAVDNAQPRIQFALGNDPVDATTVWTTWNATDMIVSNNPIWVRYVPRDDRADTPQALDVDIRRIS